MKFNHFAIIFFSLLSCSVFALDVNIIVLDHKQNPLPDVVVYLEPLEPLDSMMPLPKVANVIEISQKNNVFSPYISVMQVGQSVSFDNQDDITHQIYSPIGKNKFSFKIKAGEQQMKSDFNQKSEITMGCNIHDWMSGHLLVLDTPYFTKSDQQGLAKITPKYAGKYQLTIWHPQMRESNNRLTRVVILPITTQIEMKLTKAMKDIPEQKFDNDDLFYY